MSLAFAALAALSLAGPGADVPATRSFQLSGYERDTLALALSALGLTEDPSPEGKLVEAVDAVRLEVLEERDPVPGWARAANRLHAVSREGVVRRELLLREGEPWRQTLADESRRNLAALPQLSVVLVAAALGSAPDRVRLVVVTKDVWSLRLNWDAAYGSGGLESVTLQPAETNFLGTHQTVGFLYGWLPRSASYGLQYAAPRLGATHVAAAADAGLVFGPDGRREGSFADASVGLPLWSSRSEWSWAASASWLDAVTRRYSQGREVAFALDPARVSCTATPGLCLPWEWRSEAAGASASVTRSYGWARKLDLTAGFDARRSRSRLQGVEAYDAATVEAFRARWVPPDDDRVGPWLQARTYSSDFLRVVDLETLALQEDYRLGTTATLRFYPLPRALGSTRDLLGLAAGAAHLLALRDGFARASVDAVAELSSGTARDGSLRAAARLASPTTPAGRLVVDAVVLDRYENALRRTSALGGEGRLRGFPSGFFVGSRLAVANVEWRARPLRVLRSLQAAAVAFYDAGDAFERWHDLRLRHAAGAGARFLFPQLDRVVFRVDAGFPLGRPLPAGVGAASFFATFGQAF